MKKIFQFISILTLFLLFFSSVMTAQYLQKDGKEIIHIPSIRNKNVGFDGTFENITFLYPTDDTQIKNTTPEKNYGNLEYFTLSTHSNETSYILIKFDISSIPSSYTIHSAHLSLYLYAYLGNFTNFINGSIYRINDSEENQWIESNVTWESQPARVNQSTDDTFIFPTLNKRITWNVSSDIQHFRNNKYKNFGWKIIASTNNKDIQLLFRSKEMNLDSPRLELQVNGPPEIPEKPTGPTKVITQQFYNYTTSTTDPGGDLVQYGWDWDGDKLVDEWTEYYPSGEPITMSHSWNQTGEYKISVKAKDINNFQSDLSTPLSVNITKNTAPIKPTITGPPSGKIKNRYKYEVQSFDENEDQLYYLIDWGDNTTSGWIGPYDSGEKVSFNHTWNDKGTYLIRAKAKDIYDAESNWSTYQVSMPTYLNNYINNIVNKYLLRFFDIDSPYNILIKKINVLSSLSNT